MEHYALVDNTAAKQIANKKGVGKIRHLAGKVLWIQEYTSSGKVKVIQIPTNLNLSDIGTKPLSMSRTKALLYYIGMVEDDTAVGEAEYDEMVTKYEAGKKIKAMAKTLVKILALSSLEGAYGHKLTEDEKCYEIEGNEVTENDFVAGASWTISWPLAFLVLAISAVFFLNFILWKAWRKVNEEISRMKLQFEALRGEAEEFRARMAEIEVEEDLKILSQSLRFRIVTDERYASSLWEALVMIGGFRRREEEDLLNEEKEELLTREEENKLDWEAGRSRERRELIERSSPNRFERRSPNRHDTPRSLRGAWAGENVVNEEGEDEEEEESEHQAVATMDIDEDDDNDVRYGAPATEDEPEPHEPDSEMEGIGANEFGLQDQARRM